MFNDRTKILHQSPLQSFSPREKEKKRENFHKACMGTMICDRSPPIYWHLVCRFFIKALIIISIPTNIHRPYMCDPLGSYQITLYWSTLMNYLDQYIDLLINDQFNLIDRLSWQPVRCQAIQCTLRELDGELFPNMNTRVPSEPIFLLTHEFKKTHHPLSE